MPKLKPHETLWIHSMGKRFALTAIFQSDVEANAYMASHKDEAVISEAAGFIFIACVHAGIRPQPD